MFALIAACGGGDDGDTGNGFSVATVTPQTSAAAIPLPSPTIDLAAALTGFIYPIDGACLPTGNQLMPNAPREYRNGTHEGIDFYGVDNCTDIARGTPVLAAKPGRVTRADHDYTPLTSGSLEALLADPKAEGALDSFRGRQVWVQHPGGIVSRYAHLSGIAPGLQVGDEVTAGQTIAFVGESGTPESVQNPGTEYHLHFEIRIGDSFLGAGEPADQVRSDYQKLFVP